MHAFPRRPCTHSLDVRAADEIFARYGGIPATLRTRRRGRHRGLSPSWERSPRWRNNSGATPRSVPPSSADVFPVGGDALASVKRTWALLAHLAPEL
jgi:hypothetical protein